MPDPTECIAIDSPDRHAARHGFPRQIRLNRPAEYQQVFAGARKLASQFFTVLVRHNELGYARIGIIVSRKCSKKAVQRNSIKRQVRESFRQHHADLGGKDIVMIARNLTAAADSQQIRVTLEKHWSEIKRLQNLTGECA